VTEEHLIAWLCIARVQWAADRERTFNLPWVARDAMMERGWLEWVEREPNWRGSQILDITDRGELIADMNDAELGIEWAEVEA
jgi:hypothetical protein